MEKLKRESDRQRTYADLHQSSRVFKIGDRVFLRVNPNRTSFKLGNYKKLAYRYYRPYEILRRRGKQSYELALPANLHVHNVSMSDYLRIMLPIFLEHILNLDDNIKLGEVLDGTKIDSKYLRKATM